jgi:hypothetical protein
MRAASEVTATPTAQLTAAGVQVAPAWSQLRCQATSHSQQAIHWKAPSDAFWWRSAGAPRHLPDTDSGTKLLSTFRWPFLAPSVHSCTAAGCPMLMAHLGTMSTTSWRRAIPYAPERTTHEAAAAGLLEHGTHQHLRLPCTPAALLHRCTRNTTRQQLHTFLAPSCQLRGTAPQLHGIARRIGGTASQQ